MYPETLQKKQQEVLEKTGSLMSSLRFYLGGGTAVALQLGHRKSVDLDWFTKERIADPIRLAKEIQNAKISFITLQIDRGTLHGSISGVRVSLLEYRYPLLQRTVPGKQYHCQLASLDDLACMKLSAISQRGSKKDFIDIYALGRKHRPLSAMLDLYQRKFKIKNIAHVIYGLSYFDDAEQERTPKMVWDVNWATVKKTIQAWIKKLSSRL